MTRPTSQGQGPLGPATHVLVTNDFPPKTGGIQSYLWELWRRLPPEDAGAQVQDALQRIAALTACHAAVKANYPLTYEKMAHILDELRATSYSTICPHGRPVMLRLMRREIEKNFDRI